MNKSYLCVLAAAALLCCGCGKKPEAGGKAAPNAGATVKFHYTLTVDGKVLETSVGKEPMTAMLGTHNVIPGLEEALASMKAGDKRKVTVAPEQGYGAYHPEGVQKVPKSAFKNTAGLKPGVMIRGRDKSGRPFQASVKDMDAENVTLDMNHPLAGKTLSFDVEVLSVQAPGS